MGDMPVTDRARYCSRGSKVDQSAMSTRKDQKDLSNEGANLKWSWNVSLQGISIQEGFKVGSSKE